MKEGYSLPKDGFIRLSEVLQVFPVGESTWRKGVRKGKYPAPYKLTQRSVAWRVSDIRKLIDSVEPCNELLEENE